MKTTKNLIKSVERFNEDLKTFSQETGEEMVTLYEDPNSTRIVKPDFRLYQNGVLTWTEEWDGVVRKERYEHTDDDDIRETLKFWRANLRRAKRYWSMDTETLDKIQDGEIEDNEEE